MTAFAIKIGVHRFQVNISGINQRINVCNCLLGNVPISYRNSLEIGLVSYFGNINNVLAKNRRLVIGKSNRAALIINCRLNDFSRLHNSPHPKMAIRGRNVPILTEFALQITSGCANGKNPTPRLKMI